MIKQLMPYRFKYLGWTLVAAGTAGAVFYLWFDFRIMMPVFAVYSSFFETKVFTVFPTNVSDEVILLLFLAGFFFVLFTREKNEIEQFSLLRTKAMTKALFLNFIFLAFSVLFVYGNGFLAILVLNLFSVPLLYLLFYYWLKRKELKKGPVNP